MVAYFPQIYPDELLYSTLARYHRHVGSSSPKQTLDDLFGNRSVCATWDLPGHLGELAANLPPERDLNPNRLARDGTLCPYYTAFQPEPVRSQAVRSMIDGSTSGLYFKLGLAVFQVAPLLHFRFCPLCMKQALNDWGEPYWQRAHQLPGVLVCVRHAIPLISSDTEFGWGNRHAFTAATTSNCRCDEFCRAQIDDQRQPLLMAIAERSKLLLDTPPEPGKSCSEWGAEYRQALAARGLMQGVGGHADRQAIHNSFQAFYGRLIDLLPGGGEGGWLDAITRAHRKAFHPLFHVLLQLWLESVPERESPFGYGPWPCLNPLEAHYGAPSSDLINLHRNRGVLIGVFECSCGYRYCRRQLDDGSAGAARPLRYGKRFEQILNDAVASRMPLRATARLLHVDPNTVRRQAKRLKLHVHWRPLPQGQSNNCHRPKAICTHCSGKRKLRRSRVDWPALDQQWSEQLLSTAKTIRRKQPPERVSLPRLERSIGRRSFLASRLQHLPFCSAMLRSEIESVEAFQIRRIQWAAECLTLESLPLKPWRLRRLANIHTPASHVVEAAIRALCPEDSDV